MRQDITYCRRRGFTLVELLVVIGIIALLIGILLSALSKAKQAGTSVVCKSILRQWAMASVMYTNANKGYQVDAYKVFDYRSGLSTYMGDSVNQLVRCPGDGYDETHRRLGPIGANTAVYAASNQDYRTTNKPGDFVTLPVSYGANENSLSSTHRGTSGGEGVFWIRQHELKVPGIVWEKVMVFADWQNNLKAGATDVEPDPATLKGAIVQPSGTVGVMGNISFRHNGMCNVAYLDTHVGYVKADMKMINGGTDLAPDATWGTAGSGQQYKLYYPFGPGKSPAGYSVKGDLPGLFIQ